MRSHRRLHRRITSHNEGCANVAAEILYLNLTSTRLQARLGVFPQGFFLVCYCTLRQPEPALQLSLPPSTALVLTAIDNQAYFTLV